MIQVKSHMRKTRTGKTRVRRHLRKKYIGHVDIDIYDFPHIPIEVSAKNEQDAKLKIKKILEKRTTIFVSPAEEPEEVRQHSRGYKKKEEVIKND